MQGTERMTAAPPRMGATEWAMLVVLSVLWGGSFFFGMTAGGRNRRVPLRNRPAAAYELAPPLR